VDNAVEETMPEVSPAGQEIIGLLKTRAGVLQTLAQLDLLLAGVLERGQRAEKPSQGQILASAALASALGIPLSAGTGEGLPEFLRRAAKAAAELRASAGVTWSRYHITGSAEGFLVEETSPDVPAGQRQSWRYPAGSISLENVAEALADHEQGL
jgi:hypothetical protein